MKAGRPGPFPKPGNGFCDGGGAGGIQAHKSLVVNGSQVLEAETVVLAIGHSARDTFETLLARGIPMEPKAFAVD